MLTFRNPEDKTSCIVLNLFEDGESEIGGSQRGELQESRRERMKADTSVAVTTNGTDTTKFIVSGMDKVDNGFSRIEDSPE